MGPCSQRVFLEGVCTRLKSTERLCRRLPGQKQPEGALGLMHQRTEATPERRTRPVSPQCLDGGE